MSSANPPVGALDPAAPGRAALVDQLLDRDLPARQRRLLLEILTTAAAMVDDDVDLLDLKITAAALAEMRTAFKAFKPYRDEPKVTIFGSARTRPDDPLYAQARAVAEALAERGWMVVTGAGPGIMAAAAEGAGRERSFGINIRLPFEQEPNPILAGDVKLISMKYFFTRKLMLMKESRAFVCLPGGFGTLDEMFELLTLVQTGKGAPVPIVFLETPGDCYWDRATAFMRDELVDRGLIEASDLGLFFVTEDVQEAVAEIERFYRNFDSLRFVGDLLVLRLRHAPSDAQLAEVNLRFGHLAPSGGIERTPPLRDEVNDDDKLALPRLKLRFTRRRYGELRQLIDALNTIGPVT